MKLKHLTLITLIIFSPAWAQENTLSVTLEAAPPINNSETENSSFGDFINKIANEISSPEQKNTPGPSTVAAPRAPAADEGEGVESFLSQDINPGITEDNWVSEKEFPAEKTLAEKNIISTVAIVNNTILLDQSPGLLADLLEKNHTPEKDIVLTFKNGYDYVDYIKPTLEIYAAPGAPKLNTGINGRVVKAALNEDNHLVVLIKNKLVLAPNKLKTATTNPYPVVPSALNPNPRAGFENSLPLETALRTQKKEKPAGKKEPLEFSDSMIFPEKVNILPNTLSAVRQADYENDRKSVLRNERDVAMQTPSKGRYLDGTLMYNYSQNKKYKIYLTTDLPTAIHLETGEYPTDPPIFSNPEAFDVTPTTYGANNENYMIVINARFANATGAMILPTNRRSYHIVFHTTEDFATEIVKFNYPRKNIYTRPVNQEGGNNSPAPTVTPRPAQSQKKSYERTILVEELKWGYETVMSCDHEHECDRFQRSQVEKLIPDNIFDDGEYTYMIWHKPPKDAPALTVITPGEEQKMINYTVDGNIYTARGVFDRAVLMLNKEMFVIIKNRNFEDNHG